MKRFFLLAAVILVAGCLSVNQSPSGSDYISIDVTPSDVFTSGRATATLEFRNSGVTELRNVALSVFNAGALAPQGCDFAAGPLAEELSVVRPGSFAVRSCTLNAPASIESGLITTDVEASAKFSSTLSSVQTVSVISEEEYRIRQAKGEAVQSRPVFTNSDGRLKATMTFSEPMPVIVRKDKKTYMYMEISNVGGGRIPWIDARKVTIEEAGQNIVAADCAGQKLYIQGTAFPKIACEISMPADVNYLDDHSILISMDYDYEIRASKQVQVRR